MQVEIVSSNKRYTMAAVVLIPLTCAMFKTQDVLQDKDILS